MNISNINKLINVKNDIFEQGYIVGEMREANFYINII